MKKQPQFRNRGAERMHPESRREEKSIADSKQAVAVGHNRN